MTPAPTSLSAPGAHTGDSTKARNLARQCNEFSAELIHARPERFAGVFACIPLPEVDVLGLDGVVRFTNANGVYLGDAAVEPVFEELERRTAVV